MRHLIWILIAFLAGCVKNDDAARFHAKLERMDTNDSADAMFTIIPVSTRTSAGPLQAAPAEPTAPYIPFSTQVDTRMFVNRLLEIEDPYSVSIIISSLAHVLMNRMQESLTAGQLPSGWIVDEPCYLIGLAEAKAHEIKAEDDPTGCRYEAWDIKLQADRRYCAILTEINTRRRNQDPY